MSAFYVGQRVRVKDHPDIRPQFVGVEGVFHSYGVAANPCADERDDCCVLIHGELWGTAEWTLEPITPPGLESLDEINALYEPEPCTADVDSRGFHVPEHGRRL